MVKHFKTALTPDLSSVSFCALCCYCKLTFIYLFQTQAFEVALVAGEGFSADQDQRQQLSRIDDRLSALVPADEFRAISSLKELDALKVFIVL